jgi:hypothetical protein
MLVSFLLLEAPVTKRTKDLRRVPDGIGYLCLKEADSTRSLAALRTVLADAGQAATDELFVWFKNRFKTGSDKGLKSIEVDGEAAFLASSTELAVSACEESEYEGVALAWITKSSVTALVDAIVQDETSLLLRSKQSREGYFLPKSEPNRRLIFCDQTKRSIEVFDSVNQVRSLAREILRQ